MLAERGGSGKADQVLIVTVLFPVFAIVVLGAALRRGEVMGADLSRGLNKLTYWIALPALMFDSLATAPHVPGQSSRWLVIILIVTGLTLLLALAVCRLLALRREAWGTFVQSAFRGNLAYLGLPIALGLPAALGDRGTDLKTAVLLALGPTIVVYNALAVLVLLMSQHALTRALPSRVAREALRNPLIWACALGAGWSWWEWPVPAALERTLSLLGQMALPSALLTIGAALATTSLRGSRTPALVASVIKVGVCPLLGWILARHYGMERVDTQVLLILLATPSAAAGYTMVTQLGGDEALSASSIALSTVLSGLAFALILAVV